MKKILKITGLQHGLPTAAIIFVFHWLGFGIEAAIFMGAYFIGREVSQSQYRKWSNDPRVIAQNIEWLDFITPCLFSAGYIIWRTL